MTKPEFCSRGRWLAGLVGAAAMLAAEAAHGVVYQFTNIADSSAAYETFTAPSIASDGSAVAFIATLDGGGSGVYVSRSGAATTIASTAGGVYSAFGDCSVNASGKVVFTATLTAGGAGVFTGSGGTVTTLADSSGRFASFAQAVINDSGMVAVVATLDAGGKELLIVSPIGAVTTATSTAAAGVPNLEWPSINASGAVVCAASDINANIQKVMYKSAGSQTATAAISNTGNWLNLGPATINAVGRLALYARRNDGQTFALSGVYTVDLGSGEVAPISTIREDGINHYPVGTTDYADLNAAAQLVFWQQFGARALYTGPNATDKVIAFNDALFGSTVSTVGISHTAIDESARIAFLYSLADGRKGVAVSEPPLPAPKTGDFVMKEASESETSLSVAGGYFAVPVGRQSRHVSFEPQIGSASVFDVEFRNNKTTDETYLITGSEAGDTGWTVEALQGGVDKWTAIKAGLNTGVMTPGAKLRFSVRLRGTNQTAALPYGTKHSFTMLAALASNASASQDSIKGEAESVEAIVVTSTGDEPDADPNDGRADVDLQKPGQQVTLRAAIQFANAHPGKDIIRFQIPNDDPNILAGVPRIQPATPLPEITEAVTIDGWSQDSNAATPPIELSGDTIDTAASGQDRVFDLSNADQVLLAGTYSSGLVVTGSDCEIRGLAINHFPLAGLELGGPNNTVQGTFFGTDPTGTIPKANGTFNDSGIFPSRYVFALRGCGLAVTSAGNLIGGGTGARQRNLFSAAGGVFIGGHQVDYFEDTVNIRLDNGDYGLKHVLAHGSSAPGIVIQGAQATGNRVEGNYFGLAPNGIDAVVPAGPYVAAAQLQPAAGVLINRASGNTIGGATAAAANYFVNQTAAVALTGLGTTGNRVIGNVVGLNINQVPAHGAESTLNGGFSVFDGPGQNDLGGYAAGEGNLLAHGDTTLIDVANSTTSVVVAGNQIGLPAPGEGGAEDGMHIGGVGAVVENNVIPQCGRVGIVVSAAGALIRHNTISGGFPGADVSIGGGIWLFGGGENRVYDNEVHDHGQRGILIQESSDNEIIGNHLHHNAGAGILLRPQPYALSSQPIHNKIEQNLIHDNGGLAISFGDGKTPTPNAEVRVFSGPNQLRNHPVIGVLPELCKLSGITLTAQGTLTSLTSTTFRLEFFAGTHSSPNGIGEGARYLGSQDVTTDFAGTANFTFTGYNLAQVGESFSVTATDPQGNTSEFSEARSIHGDNFTFAPKFLSDQEQQGVPNGPGTGNLSSLAPVAMGDGNGDGTLDYQQPNVGSLIGIAGEWLTLAAPTGVALESIVPSGPPEFASLPRGYTFPVGFLGFKVTGVEPGKSVVVKEIFHSNVAFSTVFAYGPTPDKPQPHWYEFLFDGKTGGQTGAGEIDFTFIDGKRGDHDLQADGVITTILAPAYLPPSPASAVTGAPVPNEPSGTKFASFNPPQPGPFTGTMLVGKKKVTALFAADGSVRAKVGGDFAAVPGATFTKLGQPSGDAVLATIAHGGVTTKNDQVLLTGVTNGPLQIAAREGQATDVSGVTIKSFGSIDGNGRALFFVATLAAGTPSQNYTALCSAPGDGIVHVLVVNTAQVDGKTVSSLSTIVGSAGSLAEGRWRVDDYTAGVRITFTDKSQGIYTVPAIPNVLTPWTLWASTGPGATSADPVLTQLGFPGVGPSALAFLAHYKIGSGDIVAGNDTLLFRETEAGFDLLAREGDLAPGLTVPAGTPAPTFKTIADPVFGIGGRCAFTATLAGVKPATAAGIWYAPDLATTVVLARAGDPAPGGGKFASFTSLALSEGQGSGPIFTAKLTPDPAAGITLKNNFGLWAADAAGTLTLVLRTGQSLNLGGKNRAVASFIALVPGAGSIGAAHGYDNAGHVSAVVTFTDRTTAVMEFAVP